MNGSLQDACARLGLDAAALGRCTDLTSDTTEVTPGACFIAVRGSRFDGHDLIGEALQRGAAAVICDRSRLPDVCTRNAPLPAGVAFCPVDDSRSVERALAAAFFGHPSRALRLTGITGTNGKTTSSVLIAAIEGALGRRTAVVNTLGVLVDGNHRQFDRALPPPAQLQRFLRDRRDDGHAGVVLECSSWALQMERTAGVAFDRVLVTRLSRDHLDVHPDMESYAMAKWRLVRQLAEGGKTDACLSLAADFPVPGSLPPGLPCLRFSLSDPTTDLSARSLELSASGSRFELLFQGRPAGRLHTNLPGAHNIENILGVLGLYPDLLEAQAGGETTVLSGDLFSDIAVDGRLEPVPHPGGVFVYVDYAHTPDALEIVLKALVRMHGGRIFTVFGCGGDRDREKRPMMGGIAARYSKEVYVTSDNPRSEDPQEIIAQIVAGTVGGGARVLVEPDRRAAISLALSRVGPGDVLLVAGKGHETEQVLMDRTLPFRDRTVLQEEIAKC
ncbi:UDP-N-acetylmuramoyl-L-alanyl-D-glutamate--2,6-diaminopimelate ligase [Myxococcota bacterium]|nr:UDP-N-acetylmuramoyl-L-alanyl-D-glutamate--2,6-diaminopimelate ligase [Myxococcota bacterium]MBU1411319.1 UDP-N-acetylmuramoyl-L-alanyl-D-glutamate--2,6-diaminopimelate ligase [Myxococcota bacterium]MBU1509130.1 UDP-N-acetylmuramoyl-L-alanyl-D-glutamate--2,6-diaminopimelate ligase [Myxococcota bacterium]